ncbi:DNA polymerase delta catalytic subunit isoform X2 [Arachis hypogaea]|uniref:DNA polymerase delta catalytic subunit isoform X2 n=1 Tax=Arachis hypogaea TaxID=3818 RepID=UPI000A2C3DE2|nr:DNA polymerase delta catalytic subunit [Arachis hypogaea]XP_029143645.1 DNA polymerase delta catalytic subunit [Arachis hypogaea]
MLNLQDAAAAPNVGDRVPYVIFKAAKGAKAYERSEDQIYFLENNIPIDPQYYLENQISKLILRIFEPILRYASKELLHGSHKIYFHFYSVKQWHHGIC